MVKASPTSYEEIRQQRLEENKKRMEELNLTKLAQNIRAASSPKPSPMKPRTPRREMVRVEVRRSPRVANLPSPVYKQVFLDVLERPRRASMARRLFSIGRDLSNRVYASDEARMDAIERAEALESKLDKGFPSFVKPMLQSHVTGGFWLGLPSHFCREHLPKSDEPMTLVDEKGDEYPTLYLARKNGLSAGWRGFAIIHELVDGDALVFELVKPTEFKVYILRASG